MHGTFSLRRHECAHLLDDFQNPPLFIRHAGEDVFGFGVLDFHSLDQPEARKAKIPPQRFLRNLAMHSFGSNISSFQLNRSSTYLEHLRGGRWVKLGA